MRDTIAAYLRGTSEGRQGAQGEFVDYVLGKPVTLTQFHEALVSSLKKTS